MTDLFDYDRLVEHQLRLDVRHLAREGVLRAGGTVAFYRLDPGGGRRLLETIEVRRTAEGLSVGTQPVALIWDEDLPGAARPWFACPRCARKAQHLYLPAIACRRCLGLDYAVRHGAGRRAASIARARRLREKLGADLQPFSALPRRPRGRRGGRSRARYAALVYGVLAAEGEMLDVTRTWLDRQLAQAERKGKRR